MSVYQVTEGVRGSEPILRKSGKGGETIQSEDNGDPSVYIRFRNGIREEVVDFNAKSNEFIV